MAKLCDVLNYHLCQMFDILAEKTMNLKNIKLQELEDCQTCKWLISAEDPAALGGLVKGLPQNPLCSEECSRADFIEWPFKLPPSDTLAEKEKTDSREASKCDAPVLRECTRTRSFLTCRGAQT